MSFLTWPNTRFGNKIVISCTDYFFLFKRVCIVTPICSYGEFKKKYPIILKIATDSDLQNLVNITHSFKQ